jgi:hypothetical protein
MATVKIKNVTNFARTGVVTLGIPFRKEDNIQPNTILVVDDAIPGITGQRIQWSPQGARWDNGAVKYAKAHFSTSLTANEEKRVIVRPSSTFNETLLFGLDQVTFNTFLNSQFSFLFNGNTFNFTPNDALAWPNSYIDTNPGAYDHLIRYVCFIRPFANSSDPYLTHMWLQVTFEGYREQPYFGFYFRFGFFKFRTGFPLTNLGYTTPSTGTLDPRILLSGNVELTITGLDSRVRAEQWQIPNIQSVPNGRRYSIIIPSSTLYRNRLAMGSSVCLKGVLCTDTSTTCQAELVNNGTFTITEPANLPNTGLGETWLPSSQILAMAEDWKDLYPITNVIPPRPSYVTSDADYLQRSNNCLAVMIKNGCGNASFRSVWNWGNLGTKANAKDSGAHGVRNYAYGLRGMSFIPQCNYYWIPLLEYNVRAQALRTIFWLGENGLRLDPEVLNQNGVVIWDGSFYGPTNSSGLYLGGYYRQLRTTDGPPPDSDWPHSHQAGQYIGPDQEHFTMCMDTLAGYITMDWYILENAKQYITWAIAANRTEYAVTFNESAADWGAARGAGRNSQVFAQLYDLTGDQTLKYWSRKRITDVVARTANTSLSLPFDRRKRRHLLRQNYTSTATEPTPEGNRIEKIKVSLTNLGPCSLPACLDSLEHYRPWEEGEVVLGFYLLAKGLLSENPNDTVGQSLLTYSRDIASSLVLVGFQDNRPQISSNRVLYLQFDSPAGQPYDILRFNFLANLVPPEALTDHYFFVNNTASIEVEQVDISPQGVVTPSNPPARGTLGLVWVEGDFTWNRNLTLYLKNASGTFVAGKAVRRIGGSNTGVIWRVQDLLGQKSKAIFSPSQGEGRDITQSEADAVLYPSNQATTNYYSEFYLPNPNPPFGALRPGSMVSPGSGWSGWGTFRYRRDYYVYQLQVSPALAVAREAALENFYSNSVRYPNANATLLEKIDSLRDFMLPLYSTNTPSSSPPINYLNDINEELLCFVGYTARNFFGDTPNLPISVTAPSQICSTSNPAPTVTISNTQANVVAFPQPSVTECFVPVPSVTIIEPSNSYVSVNQVVCESSVPNQIRSAGSTLQVPSLSVSESEAPIINQVITTSILPGKKISTTVTMGLPYIEPPLFGFEDSPPNLGRQENPNLGIVESVRVK